MDEVSSAIYICKHMYAHNTRFIHFLLFQTDPSPEPIQEGLQSASVPSMPRRGSFDSACNSKIYA